MCVGGMLGSYFVHLIDSEHIKKIFSIAIFTTALFLLFYKHSKNRETNYLLLKIFSFPVAFSSNLSGVSVFSVPFFMLNYIDIKKAIGTSTFIVLSYASFGSIILICLGIKDIGISLTQIGYLNTPVFCLPLFHAY